MLVEPTQFPVRIPIDFALFTRAMPAASSGASSALSAASAASFRIADIRMIIDDEPRPRSSREARHALTVALQQLPGRGSSRNHRRNSSSAMLYTRLVIGDETLSSTRAFNLCQFAIFSATIKSFILGAGSVLIRNSTFANNFVSRGAAPVSEGNGQDEGGAIVALDGSLTVIDSTIAENSSTAEGSGIVLDGSASFVLENAILANIELCTQKMGPLIVACAPPPVILTTEPNHLQS